MTENIIETVKGFLLRPVETFQEHRGASLGKAFQYYTILLIIFTILYGIVSVITGLSAFNDMVVSLSTATGLPGMADLAELSGFVASASIFFVYLLFLMSLFGIFLSGFITHVFVLLMGGERGFIQTLKVVMYAQTPYLLIGWIPFISIIGAIWAFILAILGIREMQELSTGRAVLVMVIPVILSLIFIILFVAMIVTFVESMVGMFPSEF